MILFFDHSNIVYRNTSVDAILHIFLDCCTTSIDSPRTINIRIYGGWDEQGLVCDERTMALEYYSRNAPSYFKHNDIYYKVKYTLSDTLIIHTSNRIRNTFVTRKYGDIRIRQNPHRGCINASCEQKKIIKWVRSGKACTSSSCPNTFSSVFVTREQKQVDILMATDLIHCALNNNHSSIGVVTSDTDFTPALYYAATRSPGTKIVLIRSSDRSFYWENDNNIPNLFIRQY